MQTIDRGIAPAATYDPPEDAPRLERESVRPGDLVVHHTGGPVMTVIDTGSCTDLVFVRWHGEGRQHQWSFPPCVLVAVPKQPPTDPTDLADAVSRGGAESFAASIGGTVTGTSCSWCHALNPIENETCHQCRHKAHKPRMLCDCKQCVARETYGRR